MARALLADRRLGDAVQFGGLGKALRLHEVGEDFEVLDLHGKRFSPNPLQNYPRLAAETFSDKNLRLVI